MKLLLAAAAALCLSTSAFAQQAPGTGTPASAGNLPSSPVPSAGSTPSAAASSRFRQSQDQDQWLVGNVWNKTVYNAAGQKIGDLKDVLIDRDGKVAAIIVGVGGFLGLGEKNVAVDYDFLKQNGGITGDRIVVGMSEQDLRDAPSFQRAKFESKKVE
jgi:sporulation protein YlmC with PRC-barrel domain